MKLFILIPSLEKGGIERSMSRLSRGLLDRGWDVSIISEKPSKESISYFDERVKLLSLGSSFINQNSNIFFSIFKNIFYYFKIKKYIKKYSPDVLLAVKNIPVSIFLKIILKNKFKLIIREAVNPKYSSITQRSLLSRIFVNNLKKLLYPKADNIIAISEGVKQSLVKNFNLDSSKIQTIYNPSADEKILSLAKEDIDRDLISNRPLIVSIGRLTKQKDHITLLKAFNKIHSNIDCNLYIIGEGSERRNLEKFIKNNNIDNKVKLLGYQNNPWKFLSKSNLFVLPSIWEGFGNVIVESMLIGIPVISSDCPSGPREILNNGKSGKLFQVGDYNHLANIMEEIISSDNSELINYAKLRSKDFTIEKITQEYQKVLTH